MHLISGWAGLGGCYGVIIERNFMSDNCWTISLSGEGLKIIV